VERLSDRTSLTHRITADPIDRRIPVTDLFSPLPRHEQALASRVIHSGRKAIASGVFDLKHHSIEQASATKVFNLDDHTLERVPAPKLVHLNRHNLAPRIFHLISPRHWAVWYTQTIYQRTEIRVRRSAARGLLNLAHFFLARIRNREPKAHPDLSARCVTDPARSSSPNLPARMLAELGSLRCSEVSSLTIG